MTDKYKMTSNEIQTNKYLSEITGVEIVIGGAIIQFIIYCIMLYRESSKMVDLSNENSKLTDKLTSIIGDGNVWKVRLIDTNYVNAFTYGGKNLYITSELFKLLTEREILAVMLHEAGHSSYNHLWKLQAIRQSGMASILYAIVVVSSFASGPIGVIAYFTYRFYCMFIVNYWSRVQEFDADDFAIKYGYGKDLSDALKKLGKAHGNQLGSCTSNWCKISRKMTILTSTHPELKDRIESALKKSEAKAIFSKERNFTKALLKISKLAGVSEQDANEALDSIDKEVKKNKIWEFLNRDVKDVFKLN